MYIPSFAHLEVATAINAETWGLKLGTSVEWNGKSNEIQSQSKWREFFPTFRLKKSRSIPNNKTHQRSLPVIDLPNDVTYHPQKPPPIVTFLKIHKRPLFTIITTLRSWPNILITFVSAPPPPPPTLQPYIWWLPLPPPNLRPTNDRYHRPTSIQRPPPDNNAARNVLHVTHFPRWLHRSSTSSSLASTKLFAVLRVGVDHPVAQRLFSSFSWRYDALCLKIPTRRMSRKQREIIPQ